MKLHMHSFILFDFIFIPFKGLNIFLVVYASSYIYIFIYLFTRLQVVGLHKIQYSVAQHLQKKKITDISSGTEIVTIPIKSERLKAVSKPQQSLSNATLQDSIRPFLS
jgi:hypothetical protein